MTRTMVIAGGGIGGLAAALACSRAGMQVQLLEQSAMLGEVGAGIQLGPNVVRILEGWGLGPRLRGVAAYPGVLEVRHALNAQRLGVLPLGTSMVQKYGAAYATVARADLHGLLQIALQQDGVVPLQLNTRVQSFAQQERRVVVQPSQGDALEVDALLGADGLWSAVRTQLLGDGPPRVSGHLAYRAMLPQARLPEALRTQVVTAWLGPKFHVVQYPVRGGEWLNVVAIVQGPVPDDLQNWDHSANAGELRALLANGCGPLLDLVHAIDEWRLWPLCDRPPMRSAAEQAQGRVALLGDAAHPMRPYLAQGAGMALEDAAELGGAFAMTGLGIAQTFALYAQNRWQRNARVQARSIRNGEIFHAQGLMRVGRDAAMRMLGARLMDVPWLYGGS